MTFREQQLATGLSVIAECNPHAVSAAVAFFVKTGARDERPDLAGVSHFLEHMAFKGTDTRSAGEVNRQFDEIGAKYNAFTAEEHTVFHAAVLPEYLPSAIGLVADLLRPALRPEDFEMEKQVILEEIGMYCDAPMWSAFERIMRLHFSDHPLGNSVLGSKETVSRLTPEAMGTYHTSRYSPANIFVAAAGRVDWEPYLELVAGKCGGWEGLPAGREVRRDYRRSASELVHRREFVQECIYLMSPAPPADSRLREAADVLATIVGDETGSRFYWALVEPGTVESADFHYHEYEGAGAFLAGFSGSPELAATNLAVVRQTLDEVSRNGVTPAELDQAKSKLASRIVIAAERPHNRLFAVGFHWSYRKEYRTVADDLRELEAVTRADIDAVLDRYPLCEPTIVALGPLEHLAGL